MAKAQQPSRWMAFGRWALIALACVVSLMAIYYGVVDLWSSHSWNEYRRKYEAHVAPLDGAAYIPKEVAESENFAATPFVQSFFSKDANFLFDRDAYSHAANLVGSAPRAKMGRRVEDLVGWQEAFAAVKSQTRKPKEGFWSRDLDPASRAQAASGVLYGLTDDEEVLNELRSASARAEARYPVVYNLKNPWGILLPHLAKIKQTCQRLELKACADLALSRSEDALQDVKLMLYLADTLKIEPFLISYLVRAACLQITIQPIWEGLTEHRWTDEQLVQLQSVLGSYDFLTDVNLPLHAERAVAAALPDQFKKNGLKMLRDFGVDRRQIASWSKPPLSLLVSMIPSGWYDQEKTHYCQMLDRQFQGAVDLALKKVYPREVAARDLEFKQYTNSPWSTFLHHRLLGAFLIPSVNRMPYKAATAQVVADQAFVACALERYHLARHQYPENLEALVPRFAEHLPNDVIGGEAYKYRRLEDDRFLLYSVGWNETDDGGVAGRTQWDQENGDWIW